MSEIEKNTKKDRENELDDIDAAFDGLLSDKTGNTGRDPEDQIADVKGTDVPKQTSSRDSTHAVEDVEDETEDRRQEASIQKASDEVIEETEIPVERGIDSNAAVKEETDAYDVKRAKRHVWGEIDIFQEAALMDYSREKTETSKTNRREDVREVLDRKKEKVYEFKVRSLRNAGDYADRSLKEAKEAEKEKTREEIAKDQGVEPVQVTLTAAQERQAEATVENDKELLYRLRKEGHEKEIGYEEDAIVGRTGDSLWKNLPKEKRVQKEQALRDAIREEWGGVEDPSGFEAFYRQLSLARETNDQKKIGELQAKLEKRFPGEGQAIMDALGRSDNLRSSSTIMLQKRMLVVLEQDKENGTNNYDSIKKWLDDESVPPNFKLKKLDELIEQLQRTREEQGLKRDERLDGLKHAENTMEKESIRQAMKEEIAVLEEREQDIELQFAIIDPQLAESRVPEARVPVAKLITDGGFEIANEMMAGGIEKMPDGTIRGKVGGDEWVYIRERENPDAGGGPLIELSIRDGNGDPIPFPLTRPNALGFDMARGKKVAIDMGSKVLEENPTLLARFMRWEEDATFMGTSQAAYLRDLVGILAGVQITPVRIDAISEMARFNELNLFVGTRPTPYGEAILDWLKIQVGATAGGDLSGFRQGLDPDVLPRLVQRWKMDAARKTGGLPSFYPYEIGEIMREDFL